MNINEVAIKITHIWEAILDIPVESNDSNFFSLGGNSIQAMKIIAEINEEFSLDLDMMEFFDTLTITNLANLTVDKLKHC